MSRNQHQLQIIHLSDLHFGRHHRFQPPPAINGDSVVDTSFPDMLSQFRKIRKPDEASGPCILVLSGDFTEEAKSEEFKQAAKFSQGLSQFLFGHDATPDSVHVTCGNHDVQWSETDRKDRLDAYRTKYVETLFGNQFAHDDQKHGFTVQSIVQPVPAIVVSINSSMYVAKGTEDAHRGRYDVGQLAALDETLSSVSQDLREKAIKVLVTHHHPVLLPPLTESGRGYDSIENADKLIHILRKNGFHLILHGHKHWPLTAGLDYRNAFMSDQDHEMVVVAGGSVGSTELPRGVSRATNTYNHIVVKWDTDLRRMRVHTTTYGLCREDEQGVETLPNNWRWILLRVDDRFAEFNETARKELRFKGTIRRQGSGDTASNDRRSDEYRRLRGNMLVLQMRPSLSAGHGYEVVFCIEQKDPYYAEGRDCRAEVPDRVIYRGGRLFGVIEPDRSSAPSFDAAYQYFGGFLIEAELIFSDGCSEFTTAFAPTSL